MITPGVYVPLPPRHALTAGLEEPPASHPSVGTDALSPIPSHAYTHPMPTSRPPRGALRACAAAFALALATAACAVAGARSGGYPRTGPNGLAYSSAGAGIVQRQPAPGSCHARGSGLYSTPDPLCTPGALNPAVTDATIDSTICRPGWTATVRPPESITEPEKLASMAAYGEHGSASAFEYDHLVPLELGGAVNDPRNLWPEPDYASVSGFYRNPKDHLELALKRLVCDGSLPLSQAQLSIAVHWVAAYRRYG